MRLDEELKCFGLLGFGSGVAWGRAKISPDEKLDGRDGHCAKECPEAARCLLAHRKRVQFMYPKAAKYFDGLMQRYTQAMATKVWREKNPSVPLEPYLMQMVMNAEDGIAVAQTGAPQQRGRLTLKWPR